MKPLAIASLGVGAHFRVTPHLSDWLNPYAQLGGGFAWSPITMRYEGVESALVDTSHFFSIAVGAQTMINKHLGFFVQATYEKAEVARTLNTVGGTAVPHDSGGFSGTLGVRAAF